MNAIEKCLDMLSEFRSSRRDEFLIIPAMVFKSSIRYIAEIERLSSLYPDRLEKAKRLAEVTPYSLIYWMQPESGDLDNAIERIKNSNG